MQPLLKIENVSISVAFKTTRGRLAPAADNAQRKQGRANVNRTRGRANIQSTPAKVNIDTTEARASVGLKSAPRAIRDNASAGQAVAQQVTQAYAEQGNQVIDSQGQTTPAEMAASKMIQTAETIMAFIPATGPELDVTPGQISFDFSADQLEYDWDVHSRPSLEYVPGGIEFSVEQYPEVIIEYIGEPIYVPARPSA